MISKSTIALGLAALVGLGACSSLDETIVSGVTSDFYNTPDGIEKGLDAAYAGMQDISSTERGMTFLAYGTDIWSQGADGSHKWWSSYGPQLESRDSYAQEQWDDTYRDINTVNTVIGRADSIPTSASFTAEHQAQVIGQAKFLRALYYFFLVRTYGDVSLVTEETTEATTEAHRTPVADIYANLIIPDLQAAIDVLPLTSDQGRATKGAAEHVLALVYLTRQDPGDAEKAAALAEDVINSGVYDLLPNYTSLWDMSNENNKEVIFSVQSTLDPLTAGDGNSWNMYFKPYYEVEPGMTRDIHYGRAFKRLRPSAYFLDSLFVRDIDNRFDSSFRTVWLSNSASGPEGMEVGDTAIFMPKVKTSALDTSVYCHKLYRVFTEPEDFWHPDAQPFGEGCKNVSEYNRADFMDLIKYKSDGRTAVNQAYTGQDWVMYRLGGTYLLAAEAYIRAGQPAKALPFINTLRERAAKPGHEADMDVTVADMTLDFVLAERARELFGEGHRWFSLVRFGKLVEYVQGRNMDATPNIDEHFILRPIPQSQIDLTQNEDGTDYGQNPGY